MVQQTTLNEPGLILLQVALNMPGGFSIYPWEELFIEAVAQVKKSLLDIGVKMHSEEVSPPQSSIT